MRTSGELSALYIMPAVGKGSIWSIFSTHPPVEKRIAALQRLEGQLQGTA
jgi:heat shock protein HtpX